MPWFNVNQLLFGCRLLLHINVKKEFTVFMQLHIYTGVKITIIIKDSLEAGVMEL